MNDEVRTDKNAEQRLEELVIEFHVVLTRLKGLEATQTAVARQWATALDLEQPSPAEAADRCLTLREIATRAARSAERTAIEEALIRCRWNRKKTAATLGLSYKGLLFKMQQCGMREPNTGVELGSSLPVNHDHGEG